MVSIPDEHNQIIARFSFPPKGGHYAKIVNVLRNVLAGIRSARSTHAKLKQNCEDTFIGFPAKNTTLLAGGR